MNRRLSIGLKSRRQRQRQAASLQGAVIDNEQSSAASIALGGNFNLGTPPSIQILSPQPGEIVQQGKPFTIRWQTTSNGFNIANHNVELSIDGGVTFTNIAPNLPAQTQEFEFTQTGNRIPSAQIRITSTDISAGSRSVVSGIFSIGDRLAGDDQPPTVRFLNPLGGERFNSGDNIMITWSSADILSQVPCNHLTLACA